MSLRGVAREAARLGGLRGTYLASLADCFATMWDLAQEMLGRGPAVPYERCVLAPSASLPSPPTRVSSVNAWPSS
jgi:hypothetical protein